MIDINYIKQKINNDVFDKNELLNILNLLLKKLNHINLNQKIRN